MDSKTFWTYVIRKKDALKQDHRERIATARATNNPGALEGQPAQEGAVFIATIANELLDIPGGRVSAAVYGLAAQRIIESSHRLATASEIQAHLKLQQENLALTRALDLATRQRQQITVAPAAPAPLTAK